MKARRIFQGKSQICFRFLMCYLLISGIFSFFDAIPASFAELIAEEDILIRINVKEGFFIFWSDIFYSKSLINPYNETCTVDIQKGWLSWKLEDNEATNVTVFDNLGNYHDPVINDSTLLNPRIKVDVPPLFIYKLSISYRTQCGFSMVGLSTFYDIWLIPMAPTKLTVSFPDDFTILNSTQGAVKTGTNSSIELNWMLEENVRFDLSICFLPFQTTVKDIRRWMILSATSCYDLSVEVSDVFPQRGFVEANIEEVYQIPASIGEWKVELSNTAYETAFPLNVTEIVVEEVWDGIGKCTRVWSPLKNATGDNLGYYYVDTLNRRVITYPRFHLKQDFYEFKVGARYRVPAEIFGHEIIQEVPYPILFFQVPEISYRSHITAQERDVPAYTIENITSSIVVKFILPDNTEPDLFRSTPGAQQGRENGKPVVYWVITMYGDIEMEDYIVVYNVCPLRDGFILGCVLVLISFFTTMVTVLVTVILPKELDGKRLLIPPLFSSVPITSYMIALFTVYGGTPTFLNPIILSVFFILLVLLIVPTMISVREHRRIQKKIHYIS